MGWLTTSRKSLRDDMCGRCLCPKNNADMVLPDINVVYEFAENAALFGRPRAVSSNIAIYARAKPIVSHRGVKIRGQQEEEKS